MHYCYCYFPNRKTILDMNQAIRGFDDESDYRKVTNLLFRFTRNVLRKKNFWRPDMHDYKSTDIVTDAVINYSKRIEKGYQVDNRIKYLKKIIIRIIVREQKKEKATDKEAIVVYNSTEESSEQASFIRWEKESDTSFSVGQHSDLLHISNLLNNDSLKDSLSEFQLKISNFLNEGYSNKEIANKLACSEGHISRLIKNIRIKISQKK